MHRRFNENTAFVRLFFRYAFYVRHVLGSLLTLLVLGGLAISRLENIDVGAAIYFAFITGMTIGYGDITPETVGGRVASVAIGLNGMIFTAVMVAVATRALADAVRTTLGSERSSSAE